jgi:RNA polymerase sigma-70 factor (ECF subfamily)
MSDPDTLARRFETDRSRLQGLAQRMLGSPSEAEDAVQETWIRLTRADLTAIHNLSGWLTTVLSRVCLDLLRARAARREDLVGQHHPDQHPDVARTGQPEHEALLVDDVGRALLVVLDTLGPAERIAFVLHDMFAVPFEEIALVLDRLPATVKKLASRARAKVRGTPAVGVAELAAHRHVVDAFLAASRAGDVDAIIAVLDPDVVRRADRAALPPGRPLQVRGARTVAEEVAVFGTRARFAAPALVDGDVGILVAPAGRLQLVLLVSFLGEAIDGYEIVADPARLAQLEIAVLPN